MEMMNRLMSDALDSQKFIDRIKNADNSLRDEMRKLDQVDEIQLDRPYENRQQRRARERAEAKAARKAQKA